MLEFLLFFAMFVVLIVFGTMAVLTIKDYYEEDKKEKHS